MVRRFSSAARRGVRSSLANSISTSLKRSFAASIGLFLAFLGLYETGIVTGSVTGMLPKLLLASNGKFLRTPDVPVKIGNLRDPQVLLAIFGFLMIAMALHRRVRGGEF